MQAIWRGAINFGLISIPVRLFSATEEKSVRFNLLHKEDGGRIRNNRTCTVCGTTDLGKDDLVRAFEYEKGAYVQFSDDESGLAARKRIETLLAGLIDSPRPTHTY